MNEQRPFLALLKSRKFLLMVLDTVIAMILFFVGKYIPVAAEDVNFIIGAIQPVFIAVIIGIAVEDAAEKSAPFYIDMTDEDEEVFG